MSNYTRVNTTGWVASPATTTPISAANLNIMDAGIAAVDAAKPDKTGDTFTGDVIFQATLSGATKVLAEFVATDGKTYRWRMLTSGALELFNNTDSVTIIQFGPTSGAMTAGGSTNKVWHQGNDGAGSGLDADLLDGQQLGNSSGNVALSNGTVCTNLNADKLDGLDSTDLLRTTLASARISIQSSAPSSPATGDLWVDTSIDLGT